MNLYKIPLLLQPQPDGGFVVSSPVLPELVTEGDTIPEAIANAGDALAAVIELYRDLGKPFPAHLRQEPFGHPILVEELIAQP